MTLHTSIFGATYHALLIGVATSILGYLWVIFTRDEVKDIESPEISLRCCYCSKA
jgi:hypothetical protein